MKNLAINIVNFFSFFLIIDDGLFSVQYFPIIALSDWDQLKYFDELNCIWTKCYKFLLLILADDFYPQIRSPLYSSTYF